MRYGNRLALIALVTIAVLIGVLLVLAATQPAAGATAPERQTASIETNTTEATPTAQPASRKTVLWAKHWRRVATKEWMRYNTYREAFRWRWVDFNRGSRQMPPRAAPESVWFEAGRSWKHDAVAYRAQAERLHARIVSTKGGGAYRWLPLIRYWWPEWSETQARFMAHILWHESSGRPFAWNNAGSGAFGLFQLLPKPSDVWGPWSQARAARWKYDHGGLAHWAGCRAFSCPGGCGIY